MFERGDEDQKEEKKKHTKRRRQQKWKEKTNGWVKKERNKEGKIKR